MIWLITEILLPIIVAGLVGLGFGFWVAARMCDRRVQDRDAQIARLKLERDNAAANRPQSSGHVAMPVARSLGAENSAAVRGARGAEAARAEPSLTTPSVSGGANASAGTPASKPPGIEQPRDGGPDPLQRINGIGPKIEKTLNGMGVYHYDQIAAWQPEHAAWVDGNLKFRGRIAREKWIEQARELADKRPPPAAPSSPQP